MFFFGAQQKGIGFDNMPLFLHSIVSLVPESKQNPGNSLIRLNFYFFVLNFLLAIANPLV